MHGMSNIKYEVKIITVEASKFVDALGTMCPLNWQQCMCEGKETVLSTPRPQELRRYFLQCNFSSQ